MLSRNISLPSEKEAARRDLNEKLTRLVEMDALGEQKLTVVKITQGMFVVINKSDLSIVSKYRWHCYWVKNGSCYAVRRSKKGDDQSGGRSSIFMHTQLTGFKEVDHGDGVGLNNSRSNLRDLSHIQNTHGFRRKLQNTSSKYRGVTFRKDNGYWRAVFSMRGKRISAGQYETELEAAIARDDAAIRVGFLVESLNFPERYQNQSDI